MRCHDVCAQASEGGWGGWRRGGGHWCWWLHQPAASACAITLHNLKLSDHLLQSKQATHALAAGRPTGPSAASGWLPPRHANPPCCARCSCATAGTAQHDILHAFLLDRPIYAGPSAGIAPRCLTPPLPLPSSLTLLLQAGCLATGKLPHASGFSRYNKFERNDSFCWSHLRTYCPSPLPGLLNLALLLLSRFFSCGLCMCAPHAGSEHGSVGKQVCACVQVLVCQLLLDGMKAYNCLLPLVTALPQQGPPFPASKSVGTW